MMVYLMLIGSVVQLDRMSDSGSDGWGFESLRSHKYKIINPQFILKRQKLGVYAKVIIAYKQIMRYFKRH